MNNLKFKIISIILCINFYSVSAQVVTTNPAFPTLNDEVVITFNAAQGNGGLAGYTDDIYAHTGVITDQNSGWEYVIAGWSENIPKAKLTKIEENKYELLITPSIKEYYGVPNGEQVLKLAFVFRNSDGSITGRDTDGSDIFADVYELGINVNIISPENEFVAKLNDTIQIKVEASEADSIFIEVDGTELLADSGNYLNCSIIAQSEGIHYINVTAKNDSVSAVDSVCYYVMGNIVIEDLPEGVSNGINYIDDNTVTLVLFAPNKEYVFAIGDFNDWKLYPDIDIKNNIYKQVTPTSYLMNKTPDGNQYWIELNNLIPEQEYIFQYYIDGEIKIADPYTDKTSDPWMDKYISESIYPGLIDYPEGKTTEIASVFQTAQEPYAWEVVDFEPPDIENLVIYELLIRDFTSNSDYKTVKDTLNYLKNLGISAIELMPVNEFEGNDSWGYNPSFYFAPDKAYGTKNDLKELIDECHKLGMAVIIDLVLNHSYNQSPFVRMYWDAVNNRPAADNPWYNQQSNFTNTDAHWGNDFNHESEETKKLIDSINSYWLLEYKVDGFRFDFTKGFGNTIHGTNDPWGSIYDADRIALLKRMSDKIWEHNENAIIIFEHLSENSEETELANYGVLLWGNMNHNYNEATMGWNSSSDFSWISYKNRNWNDPNVIGYMESHDEERLVYKNINYGNSSDNYNIKDLHIAIQRIEIAATFFITIPGPKMIWQFGELGYDYSIDYNGRLGRKPVKWDYFDQYSRKRLYQVFSALINLKNDEPAFKSSDFSLSVSGAMKKIHIDDASMDVTIIGNFDVNEGTIVPAFQNTGTWYEFFTGDSIIVNDINENIALQPGEYRLYTTKKLVTPDIISDVKEIYNNNINYTVYPNPSNDYFTIDLNEIKNEIVSVEIINSIGQKIKSFTTKDFENGDKLIIWNGKDCNGSEANSGLYFCKVNTRNGIYTKKLIKY
ncbi:MAG: T9SS type A sorting domain-containing protein [Bacteroidales bacterium]|nr:T9SS type A sorting domain-containing protein [Bacteroidales bacterium]